MNVINTFAFFLLFAATDKPADKIKKLPPERIRGLVTFWDFQKQQNGTIDFQSRGAYNYLLKEMNGRIASAPQGVFGPSSLRISRGQWLMIPRKDCPALDIQGKQNISMVAWVMRVGDNNWQYIAGMWNERDAQRQYALITCAHRQTDQRTLERTVAKNQTHGYVSDVGGPTPGKPFCYSYATGQQKIAKEQWYMLAFTYDHRQLRVYVNGVLDYQENYNPFNWDKPIYSGGVKGSDFTVAQRALPLWPGYPQLAEPPQNEGFDGLLGGLAVYRRALTESEINNLYQDTMQRK